MNSYEKKASKAKTSQWLNNIENTASDRKLPMGSRIKKGAGSAALKLISGIGGGFAGAAIGRWSILGGILATGTGEVIGSPELTSFGVGMMASNLIPAESTVNGTEEEKSSFQKAKDRVKTYGKGIMQKFWIDKIVKKDTTQTEDKTAVTTTTQTTSGVGEVKYYRHPQSQPDEMDMRELEKYEQEIIKSGEEFSGGSVSGTEDDENLLGTDDEKIY